MGDSPATHDWAASTQGQHRYSDYGGNPLAHTLSHTGSVRLPAFGGSLQPGLAAPSPFKFANPVPLGLAGFALTTFLFSCINLGVCGLTNPAIVIAPAIAYGGLCQILAGMWDLALGNVFGGTALSSFGGLYIGVAITLTPGGFQIEETYGSETFNMAFGLYLFGWFIVAFLLWLCTLKSTVFFSSLFLTIWLAFLCLGIAYVDSSNGTPNVPCQRAGGAFGIIAAFLAWYNMLAGLAEPSTTFIVAHVIHFPWSEKGRAARREGKEAEDDV